jgi:hypothetical protein
VLDIEQAARSEQAGRLMSKAMSEEVVKLSEIFVM